MHKQVIASMIIC